MVRRRVSQASRSILRRGRFRSRISAATAEIVLRRWIAVSLKPVEDRIRGASAFASARRSPPYPTPTQ